MNGDITTRIRISSTVDRKIHTRLQELSQQTRIPKARLIDEAISDLLRKHTNRKEEQS